MNNIRTINSKNNNNVVTTSNLNSSINHLNIEQYTNTADNATVMVSGSDNYEIRNHKIIAVQTPNFVSIITGIPTDESFAALCQHPQQDLMAYKLANMLTKADYKEIRKWATYSYYSSKEDNRKSPLEVAALYNNLPVCKTLIESLQPKNKLERMTLQHISNYKPYGIFGYYYEILAIQAAFSKAVAVDEELAMYLFAKLNKDLYVFYGDFSYLEYFCDTFGDCYTIKMLDFLVNHIQEFLVSHHKLTFKQHFIYAVVNLLVSHADKQNWHFVSYILEKDIDINYKDNGNKINYVFLKVVKNKKFNIATNILNKDYISINTILFDKNHYKVEDNKYYTTLEILAITADVEAVAWLLTVPSISSEMKNAAIISALYLAIAKKRFVIAHLLKFFYNPSPLEIFEEEQQQYILPDKQALIRQIQNFLSKPESLANLASISLGLKYVKNSIPIVAAKHDIKAISERLVKQENTIIDLNLNKKITSLADVFNLNLYTHGI